MTCAHDQETSVCILILVHTNSCQRTCAVTGLEDWWLEEEEETLEQEEEADGSRRSGEPKKVYKTYQCNPGNCAGNNEW